MSIAGIRDSGGGVLNNKFINSTVGRYLILAFLCLTTLSTIGLAISTGVLDQRYKVLRDGYFEQSNALQSCLKNQNSCSGSGDDGITYLLRNWVYNSSQQEEQEYQQIKYVKINAMNSTTPNQRRLRGEGEEFQVINSTIEPFDGDMPDAYTTINIQSDGSLIIGASDKFGNDISSAGNLTWGFPWSSVAIQSKIGVQGKQALLVDKPITGTAESDFVVELNAINSKQGAGISVNNINGNISVFTVNSIIVNDKVNYDINVTGEVGGDININKAYADPDKQPNYDTALGGSINIYGAVGGVYVSNVTNDVTFVGSVNGGITVQGSVNDIYVNSVDDYINIDGNVGSIFIGQSIGSLQFNTSTANNTLLSELNVYVPPKTDKDDEKTYTILTNLIDNFTISSIGNITKIDYIESDQLGDITFETKGFSNNYIFLNNINVKDTESKNNNTYTILNQLRQLEEGKNTLSINYINITSDDYSGNINGIYATTINNIIGNTNISKIDITGDILTITANSIGNIGTTDNPIESISNLHVYNTNLNTPIQNINITNIDVENINVQNASIQSLSSTGWNSTGWNGFLQQDCFLYVENAIMYKVNKFAEQPLTELEESEDNCNELSESYIQQISYLNHTNEYSDKYSGYCLNISGEIYADYNTFKSCMAEEQQICNEQQMLDICQSGSNYGFANVSTPVAISNMIITGGENNNNMTSLSDITELNIGGITTSGIGSDGITVKGNIQGAINVDERVNSIIANNIGSIQVSGTSIEGFAIDSITVDNTGDVGGITIDGSVSSLTIDGSVSSLTIGSSDGITVNGDVNGLIKVEGTVNCNDPTMSCVRLENGIDGSYSEGLYIGSQPNTTNAITGFMNVGINISGDIKQQINSTIKEYNPGAAVNISGNIISHDNIRIGGNLNSTDYGVYINNDYIYSNGSNCVYIQTPNITQESGTAIQIEADIINSPGGDAIEITSSNGIVSGGIGVLINASINSIGNAIQVGYDQQQQEEESEPIILYQLNSTSGCGFELFGDTHSDQGIRIAASGYLYNGTMVGGNVNSNNTGIEVYGDVSAYNIGVMINGGIVSPNIKLINSSGGYVPDNVNPYKGIQVTNIQTHGIGVEIGSLETDLSAPQVYNEEPGRISALVVSGYINSSNGSSTAISVQGSLPEVANTSYSVMGRINISEGVFSSNETAIEIGQDNNKHTQIVGDIYLPAIIGNVQVGKSNTDYNNVIDNSVQQINQEPITCIPVDVYIYDDDGDIKQYYEHKLINLTYIDGQSVNNSTFENKIVQYCSSTVESNISDLVKDYVLNSTIDKQIFKFVYTQIPLGYRNLQYNNTFVIRENINCPPSGPCKYNGNSSVINIIDTSIFVTQESKQYNNTIIQSSSGGIYVKGGINSTGGSESSAAIYVAGITSSQDAIYVEGNITSQDVDYPNIITVESDGSLQLNKSYAGVVINGDINVHGNAISVKGSVRTDLLAYDDMPEDVSLKTDDIGAIVVSNNIIMGQNSVKKLFYNITNITCFNFTYNGDVKTLFNYTQFVNNNLTGNKINATLIDVYGENCSDISTYGIDNTELILAMKQFTYQEVYEIENQEDLDIFNNINNTILVKFESSQTSSNFTRKVIQFSIGSNNDSMNTFMYPTDIVWQCYPTDKQCSTMKWSTSTDIPTFTLDVDLETSLISQNFLKQSDYSAISISGDIITGGFGIQIPNGDISSKRTALHVGSDIVGDVSVGSDIIGDVTVESEIYGNIVVAGGSVDGNIQIGGSVSNGISISDSVTGEIHVQNNVNGNINIGGSVSDVISVGGDSGPISITGNVVNDEPSGALIVNGFVQGYGGSDAGAVVQLGGIEAIDQNGGQALNIRTALDDDDSISVKGSINIEGSILGVTQNNEGSNNPVYTLSVGGNIKGNVDNLNIIGGDLTSLTITETTNTSTIGGNVKEYINIDGGVANSVQIGGTVDEVSIGSVNGNIDINGNVNGAINVNNGGNVASIQVTGNVVGNTTNAGQIKVDNDVNGYIVIGGIIKSPNTTNYAIQIQNTNLQPIAMDGGIMVTGNITGHNVQSTIRVTGNVSVSDYSASGISIQGSVGQNFNPSENASIQPIHIQGSVYASKDEDNAAIIIDGSVGQNSNPNGANSITAISVSNVVGGIDIKGNVNGNINIMENGDVNGNIKVDGNVKYISVGSAGSDNTANAVLISGNIQCSGTSDNACVQLGGINSSNGAGQALQIGYPTDDGTNSPIRVQGNIAIHGNVTYNGTYPSVQLYNINNDCAHPTTLSQEGAAIYITGEIDSTGTPIVIYGDIIYGQNVDPYGIYTVKETTIKNGENTCPPSS